VITPEGSTTTATTPPGGTTSIVTTPVAPTTATTTSTTTTSAVTTPTSNNTSGVIYGPGEATTSTTVYDSTSSALTYLTASERSNRAVWGLGFGFEVPMGALAITPRVTYTDTMEAGSDWAYHYGAEIHHWFNETAGFYADVTFNDPRVLPASWSYFAGLRFRF
jgi:hypothetical protein